MSIIEVANLGKKYKIGEHERYLALRDIFANIFKSPLSWLKTKVAAKRDEGEFWALQDVNFTVNQGEVLGIIGRNGAGKSTLLKILSQITPPTTGKVTLHGRVGSLLEVGTGFHPELTGRENIYLNGAILGMRKKEIEKKFDQIVEFAEIGQFLDTPVKRYSSGMYVRLAFSVAAHLEPDILVVDEVLAVGDADFQKKCLGKMEEVTKKDGRTVLLVSHNMNSIRRLCSSVILLDKGTVVEQGNDVEGIIRRYISDGVENFKTEWTNNDTTIKNIYFTPENLSIINQDGTLVGDVVSKKDNLKINLKFTVVETSPDLVFGYILYDGNGEVLYWSMQTDTPRINWPKIKKGKNIIETVFPTSYLNDGEYTIELIAGIHNTFWIIRPGSNIALVKFNLKSEFNESPFWAAKRYGSLAPTLEWIEKNN